MKLYIMKRDALETLKANLPKVYGKYYTESTNKWIADVCGENPFIEFKDTTEFKLAGLDSDMSPGEIDLNNCKILYERLQFLSESQASDERLWAGLTHTTFYDYMRKRWGYGYGKKLQSSEKETGAIMTRFFYKGSGRSGFYRNTLAKCWWVGHNTYDPNNIENHFESLDFIGSNDINSKITEFFFNFTFSSNPYIMAAIVEALKHFKSEGKRLLVREHIRPAMSYLNAVGGSVVLDCLEKEEITEIFIDAIEAIMQGDTPSLNLDKNNDETGDDVDFSDDAITNIDDDKTDVVLGCKVVIRNETKETKSYIYDLKYGILPKTVEVFTGHKVGDIVEISGEKWKIEDIIL
jgi:hypothetical protein